MKKETRIKMAIDLANQGVTEREILEKLGMSERTMQRYKLENEELATKLIEKKDVASKAIKELCRLAIGYTTKVEEFFKIKKLVTNSAGEEKEIEVIEKRIKTVEVPGNITALKYLLNNREKDSWSDNANKVYIDKKLLELKEKEIEAKSF